MSSFINYIKDNKEKISYSYPYLGFFSLLCFIGWAVNSLYTSYISISLFLLITPLLNKDMRLLLLPSLLSFTCFRHIFYFDNIPIPVIITSISLFISLGIYILRNIKDNGLKLKFNIITKSLLLLSIVFLLSTIIRHIFNNNYAFNNYYYLVPDNISSTSGTIIDFSKYSFSYDIKYGYLASFGLFGLTGLSILLSSYRASNDKLIYLKSLYIFSIYLLIQFYSINIYSKITNITDYNELRYLIGWGEKNVISVALEICLPITIYLYSQNRKRWDYLFVSFLLVITLLINDSRGAQITTAIVSPIYLYLIFKPSKNRWKYIGGFYGACFLLLIIAIISFPVIREKLFSRGLDLNGRNIFWTWICDFCFKNPLNAIFGGSPSILFEMSPAFSYVFTPTDPIVLSPMLAHNTIMTTLAVGGIIGLVALLYHRIDSLKNVIKVKEDYKYLLIAFIFVGIIHGLIDNTLFSVMYLIPYIMILSDITLEDISKKEEEIIQTI